RVHRRREALRGRRLRSPPVPRQPVQHPAREGDAVDRAHGQVRAARVLVIGTIAIGSPLRCDDALGSPLPHKETVLVRRALIVLMISAAALVAVPTIASGGEGPILTVTLLSPKEPLTFQAEFEDGTCVTGDFDATVEANGKEVTPLSQTQDPSNPDRFVF